jgi:hypothetical protein
VTIRGAAQTDLAGQHVKGAVDLPTVQAIAPTSSTVLLNILEAPYM